MDAQLPSVPLEAADEDFVALLAEQRARVQEFSARRRQRLQDLESDLAVRVERIAHSLAELQQESHGKLLLAEQHDSDAERTKTELETRLAEIERRDAKLAELNEVVGRERAHIVTRARRIAGRLRAQRHALLDARQQDQAAADAAAVSEIASLRDRLSQAESAREQWAAAEQLLIDERNLARQETESLRPLTAQLAALQQEVARLNEDAARFSAERAELGDVVEASQRQLADEAQERTRLTGAVDALQNSLDSVQAERDRLASERDRFAADVSALQADVAQARGALADSSAQAQAVGELQAKLQQAEQDRRQLKEQFDQASLQAAELPAARAELAKLSEQLAKYQAAEQRAAAEHAQLHGRCQELDAALAGVKAEFDRETQQASLRVESLERDLAGARQEGNAECAAQQELAARAVAAETELVQVRAALDASQAAADEGHRLCAELRESLQAAQMSAGDSSDLQIQNEVLGKQVAELQAAQCELTKECERLATQLESASVLAAGDEEVQEKIHSLEKRYSLAMEDLREEKARAAELEQKLAAARRGGGAPAASGGGLDWEAQKLRMLAMLEEYDDGDEDEATTKLTIQGTLEITDSVVAEKDQEIAELRKLLEEQSSNIGNVAVGASAIAQLIESDEVIQHERERARQLQGEWEGKMRTAEVEISVERAKLARERAELEEKLRHLEERAATIGAQYPASAGTASKEPKRGRWLERLGLKDSQG